MDFLHTAGGINKREWSFYPSLVSHERPSKSTQLSFWSSFDPLKSGTYSNGLEKRKKKTGVGKDERASAWNGVVAAARKGCAFEEAGKKGRPFSLTSKGPALNNCPTFQRV